MPTEPIIVLFATCALNQPFVTEITQTCNIIFFSDWEWDFPTAPASLLSLWQISYSDIKVFHAYTFRITILSY